MEVPQAVRHLFPVEDDLIPLTCPVFLFLLATSHRVCVGVGTTQPELVALTSQFHFQFFRPGNTHQEQCLRPLSHLHSKGGHNLSKNKNLPPQLQAQLEAN